MFLAPAPAGLERRRALTHQPPAHVAHAGVAVVLLLPAAAAAGAAAVSRRRRHTGAGAARADRRQLPLAGRARVVRATA